MEKDIKDLKIKVSDKISILYFNDPICPFCWEIEPKILKFKLEYGHYFELRYMMGGLMKDWDELMEKSNNQMLPEKLAVGWDRTGKNSGMSIDGDLWLKQPLQSSYPASKAVIAMHNQSDELAIKCLRKFREMVFLENRDISNISVLKDGVRECGGNVDQFIDDFYSKQTEDSFQHHLKLRKEMKVKQFPTFLFMDKKGEGYQLSGTDDNKNYVEVLSIAVGEKVKPKPINLNEEELLEKYNYLSTKEVTFVLSQSEEQTIENLRKLVEKGVVKEEEQKYNSFWRYQK